MGSDRNHGALGKGWANTEGGGRQWNGVWGCVFFEGQGTDRIGIMDCAMFRRILTSVPCLLVGFFLLFSLATLYGLNLPPLLPYHACCCFLL